jgi:hypothetical protein
MKNLVAAAVSFKIDFKMARLKIDRTTLDL